MEKIYEETQLVKNNDVWKIKLEMYEFEGLYKLKLFARKTGLLPFLGFGKQIEITEPPVKQENVNETIDSMWSSFVSQSNAVETARHIDLTDPPK